MVIISLKLFLVLLLVGKYFLKLVGEVILGWVQNDSIGRKHKINLFFTVFTYSSLVSFPFDWHFLQTSTSLVCLSIKYTKHTVFFKGQCLVPTYIVYLDSLSVFLFVFAVPVYHTAIQYFLQIKKKSIKRFIAYLTCICYVIIKRTWIYKNWFHSEKTKFPILRALWQKKHNNVLKNIEKLSLVTSNCCEKKK